MKKGLHVTLLTVAIAVMALQVMAMAPVIDPIPDPVVGNESARPVTQATPFIYPDAFDLNAKVADGDTPDNQILWSYSITGTPIYRINNVDPIDPGTQNPNAPGSKLLNGATTDIADVDGLSNTITIRNIKYAPLSGTAQTPSGTGLIDSQTVRLWASDGVLSDTLDLLFWTDNGGNDRLGTEVPPTYTVVSNPNFAVSNGGFTANAVVGSITITNVGGAICIEVPAAGTNFGGWVGPNSAFDLQANTVYAIRARVNGSQASAGSVPFWDLVVDDWFPTGGGNAPLTLFGGDMMVLDA
jgi:hypothetical protein